MTESHTTHPLAFSAFTISGSSGLYDRARPSYPAESISTILSLFSSSPAHSVKVAELGAGTGIFTRQFLTEDAKQGGKVGKLVAVEPAEGMRRGFVEKVVKERDGGRLDFGKDVEVEVVDGSFFKIPCGDGEVDMIIAAQAFHWVGRETDRHEAAIKEISRALKPKGHLVLIWNLEDRDEAAWVGELRDTYEVNEQDTPQYRHGYWRGIFDVPSYKASFPEAPSVSLYKRKLPTTKEGVVDRVLSKSFITHLPDKERDVVEKKVEEVVERGNGRVWIDKEKGIFEYPYKTDLYIFERQ